MPTVLGYVVAISRDSGLGLPSFSSVYDTPAEAEAEAARLSQLVRLERGADLVVLELHPCEQADA